MRSVLARLRALAARRDIHRLPVVKAFAVTLWTRIAVAGAQFVQTFLFSRILGAEMVGVYFFTQSVYRFGEATSQLGVPVTAVREVAGHKAEGGWNAIRALVRSGTMLTIGLGAAAALVLWLISGRVAHEFTPDPQAAHALAVSAWVLVPGTLGVMLAAVLRALDHQAQSNLLGPFAAVTAAIAAFFLLPMAMGPIRAVTAFGIGQTLSCALLGAAVFRATRQTSVSPGTAGARDLLASSFPVWVMAISGLANDAIGAMMLGLLTNAREVGLFGVATRIALPLGFVAYAIQSALEPRFAAASRLGKADELRRTYRRSLLLSGAAGGGAGLAALALAWPLLWLFGKDFAQALTPLLIVLGGSMVLTMLSPAGSYLMMIGKAAINAWIAAIWLPILILLLLALVPLWGATGAAIGTAFMLGGRGIAQAIAVEWLLRRED